MILTRKAHATCADFQNEQISLEILVILFWHCVHGIFCIICVVASLIFLNIELEPQLDPDYLDYTEIGPQLDQSDLSQAT